MEEREIFFKQINIEPSKVYTNSKFKLKIKLEDNFVLNTENNGKIVEV